MHASVLQHFRRALPITLFALAACGDGGGGPRLADDLPASASVMRVRAAQIAEVAEQPAILALSYGFGMPLSPATPVARGALSGVRGTLDVGAPRRQLSVGLIPAAAMGKTFVRNAANDWVVDTLANGSPRPGAPLTGVRFMLQATDFFGMPSGPPIGMLDVTPRVGGSMSTVGYRALARELDGTVVLQYDSEQALSGESGTTVGQATDGTRTIQMSETGSMRGLTTSSTAAFAGVSRTATVTTDLTDPSGPLSATTIVKIDDGTVRIETRSDDQSASFRIYSNGGLFARMDMANDDSPFVGDEPVWMRGDGTTPLDAEDQDALFAFYEMTNALPTLFAIDITVQMWLFELAFGSGMP